MWKGVTEENLISPSKFVKDATQAKSNKTLEKKITSPPPCNNDKKKGTKIRDLTYSQTS